MTNVDMEWVKDQLTNAKVTKPVGNAVIKLLDLWSTFKLSDDSAEKAVDIFSSLALGHTVAQPTLTEIDLSGEWQQAAPGFIKRTDIVRVKNDAFTGDLGRIHNGRVGKVVDVRSRDVIVMTIDGKNPHLGGAHYSPYMLEKLVK